MVTISLTVLVLYLLLGFLASSLLRKGSPGGLGRKPPGVGRRSANGNSARTGGPRQARAAPDGQRLGPRRRMIRN